MFKWVSAIFGGRKAARKEVRASYDAAKTTPENRRHWANADSLSSNAANSPGVRRILRDRARYEVDNSSNLGDQVDTRVCDTIGTGARIQVRSIKDSGSDAASRLEREFQLWAIESCLGYQLHLLRRLAIVDGEGFLLAGQNPRLSSPVKLSLTEVECDRVTTPTLYLPDPNKIDGIEFDEYRNPKVYTILRRHPGDIFSAGMLQDYDRVDARFVFHLFRKFRAEQCRGIPEIMAALPTAIQLRRFNMATISAAEVAAMFSVMIKSGMQANPDNAPEEFDEIPTERATLVTLPYGYEAQQMQPQHPSAQYEAFVDHNIAEQGRSLGQPAGIAKGNSARYNYSSSRADDRPYVTKIRTDRELRLVPLLNRIFRMWHSEASLIPGYVTSDLSGFSWSWNWDGREHVDPQKEATADDIQLRNGSVSMARIYSKRGEDWERDGLNQLQREVEAYRKAGLMHPAESIVQKAAAKKEAGSAK